MLFAYTLFMFVFTQRPIRFVAIFTAIFIENMNSDAVVISKVYLYYMIHFFVLMIVVDIILMDILTNFNNY